jgi:hypothetical protein
MKPYRCIKLRENGIYKERLNAKIEDAADHTWRSETSVSAL